MLKRCLSTLVVLLASSAYAQTFDLSGFAAARGVYASGHPTWLRNGFGRFDAGGKAPERGSTDGIGDVQLGVDWRPTSWLSAHAHGLGRLEPDSFGGDRAGLVSAHLEANLDRGANSWRIRAGQFFLGTSRENIAPLWTSPYNVTFSSLNTWIAQEVRPIGAEVQWQTLTPNGVVTTAVTAFRGNDTMGTLLAWRGWTIGNRLSVYDETLPLPPIPALRTAFAKQRHGTIPFGSDLDGRPGWSARLRYSVPERLTIQATHLDNRGDRRLHGDQYSWATRFDLVGADAQAGPASFAAEWMAGDTGMGFRPAPAVDTSFYAGYALASIRAGRNRFTGRYEIFQTDSEPYLAGRTAWNEHGRAWTLAWLFDVAAHVRSAIEFTQATGTHTEAAAAGLDPAIDGRSVTVELRYTLR